MEREIGRIIALLGELGLTRNTIVMFSSDNGPTFNGRKDSAFFESAPYLTFLFLGLHHNFLQAHPTSY